MPLDTEKTYFAGWWFWIVMLVFLSSIIFAGLRAGGLIGMTAMERAVFTQSYQKAAGDTAAIARNTATLAKINAQLTDRTLGEATRANLKGQKAQIEIRLNALGVK